MLSSHFISFRVYVCFYYMFVFWRSRSSWLSNKMFEFEFEFELWLAPQVSGPRCVGTFPGVGTWTGADTCQHIPASKWSPYDWHHRCWHVSAPRCIGTFPVILTFSGADTCPRPLHSRPKRIPRSYPFSRKRGYFFNGRREFKKNESLCMHESAKV